MSFFEFAFDLIVSPAVEGGYSNVATDPGNWTGGTPGKGILKGTMHGISAAEYPDLDIANLTLDQVKAIYQRDYWAKLGCDAMPWERALCVFDSSVNQGQPTARALNLQAHDAIDFMAERAVRYAGSHLFEQDGKGWMRRLFTIFKAAQRTPS